MRPEATVVCGLTATAVIQDSLSNGTLFVAQLSAELSATRQCPKVFDISDRDTGDNTTYTNIYW